MASDIDTLADFGIFDSAGVARLAALIRSVQALGGGIRAGGRRGGRPGRPRGRRPGRPAGSASTNGQRVRGKMTVSATELAEMRKTMTGKAIAAKLGVSIGTVTNHLKKHGLTGKRGRPAKKK
jgi:DNA-binding NarL/FixJ family response regulator